MGEVKRYEQHPNFRSTDGQLFLVRCYECGGKNGRENWALAVASGQCAWCGWSEKEVEAPRG